MPEKWNKCFFLIFLGEINSTKISVERIAFHYLITIFLSHQLFKELIFFM